MNNQAVMDLQGLTELRKIKERGLLDGNFSDEAFTSFYSSLNLSNRNIISKGRVGKLCVNTHNFEPLSFQWKVDLIHIKSNFDFGLPSIEQPTTR